jgi:cytochrome b561
MLFAVLAVLIASGYLLYYAGGDETRAIASVIHWGLGLIVLIPFILHRFRKRVPMRSRIQPDDGETEGLV